ncbi:hypothetical protein ACHWQZ_G000614, partial [Mnemiopsis leidyi]
MPITRYKLCKDTGALSPPVCFFFPLSVSIKDVCLSIHQPGYNIRYPYLKRLFLLLQHEPFSISTANKPCSTYNIFGKSTTEKGFVGPPQYHDDNSHHEDKYDSSQHARSSDQIHHLTGRNGPFSKQ